jgi:hypothetical protein
LLFVLVMEVLDRIIYAGVSGGLLPGFSVGNVGGIDLSRLMFADDNLFFCGANQITSVTGVAYSYALKLFRIGLED